MNNSKTSAIISVGHELLQGKVQDTNASYMAAQLASMGIITQEIVVIPDHKETITQAVQRALCAAEIVLITGGLGPTLDDCTREGVANALGLKLEFQENLWQAVRERYPLAHIPEVNKRQAYLIEGAKSLPNHNGTAPGMWIALAGATTTSDIPSSHAGNNATPPTSNAPGAHSQHQYIALLPGPPGEMKPLFHQEILPRIAAVAGTQPPSITTWRLYGAGESTIAEILEPFGIAHGCYTKPGYIEVQLLHPNPVAEATHCTATRKASAPVDCTTVAQNTPPVTDVNHATIENTSTVTTNFARTLQQMQETLTNAGILQTEDRDLPLMVLEKLRAKNLTVAFAESLTAGDVASAMVAHPGASQVFLGGVVAYSNSLKRDLLGVPESVLARHGAVSCETARAMALGVQQATGADIAVAVTGIAGPGGGSEAKPVGTLWMGVSIAPSLAMEENANGANGATSDHSNAESTDTVASSTADRKSNNSAISWEKHFVIPRNRRAWIRLRTVQLVYQELLEWLNNL